MRPDKKTLPVNLLLEGAIVVVVGGGRIGLRKTQLALDAGAKVRLICPRCDDAFAQLSGITHKKKRFDPADLAEAVLVFACTDDKYVNRMVLESAREQHVLCCCADGNWAEGDLTTPAILRRDGLVIGISTNGRSCQTAKSVKHDLDAYLSTLHKTQLVVTGFSHDETPLSDRAPYHLVQPDMREAVGLRIQQLRGVQEFVILNTCNRIEVLALASPDVIESGMLYRALGWQKPGYTFTGQTAFNHFCNVLAGLKSQNPGEFHIVGQVKDAFDEALQQNWARGLLPRYYALALHTAKEMRQELEPMLNVDGIEQVCKDYLTGRVVPGAKVVVAGTGTLGRSLLTWAIEQGATCTSLYHQHPADVPGITSLPLAQWEAAFSEADVVLSVLRVSEPCFRRIGKAVIVDLGAPRNVLGGDVADLDFLKNRYRLETGIFDRVRTIAARYLAAAEADYITLSGEADGH